MNRPEPSKAQRFEEFLRRMRQAPAVGDARTALEQLSGVLNAVEDELTSIPYNPAHWASDGRLYPPQPDVLRQERPGVERYRNRKHNTFIGENGSIEIQTLTGEALLSKPGADGREVKDI